MNTNNTSARIPERPRGAPVSGWLGIATIVSLFAVGGMVLLTGRPAGIAAGALLVVGGFFLCRGLLTLQPNEAAVLILFGRYAGTIRSDGFFMVNPFYVRERVSLRASNFNTPILKVNDRGGNPIDVAAVVTWRVEDTARAVFEIEDYATYINVQSETALREVASSHVYDAGPDEVSLRGSFDAIGRLLTETVQRHVDVAGVRVLEAKLTHLAYAPEVASVMLRRQQAEAVVQARERLVEGAVGMAKHALDRIEAERIAVLSDRERAALLTNLMTVLLSEQAAQPVVQMAASHA